MIEFGAKHPVPLLKVARGVSFTFAETHPAAALSIASVQNHLKLTLFVAQRKRVVDERLRNRGESTERVYRLQYA